MKGLFGILLLAVLTPLLSSQDIQINRQNKTIAVTADGSVEVDAELAVLAIGYHNFAPTQDAAYRENVRAADVISKAILAFGVPKENIESEKLRLGRIDPDEKWTPEMKKERQFEAEQTWNITVPVAQAQAVVDVAVKNGANEVSDVEWNVVDPIALQAKAGAAALTKARRIAEQMASGLSAKLGELVYASNHAPVAKLFRALTLNTTSAELSARVEEKPKLTLFPQKVKSEATVYAVFAIE